MDACARETTLVMRLLLNKHRVNAYRNVVVDNDVIYVITAWLPFLRRKLPLLLDTVEKK